MSDLPILAVIPEIIQQLGLHDKLILQAPPGAGKTTQVPIALRHEAWLENRKIIMLEPRRLAARTAAERLAKSLNESVGETVGYRIRLDSKISAKTQIEVVTEGVLVRMLQSDPSLSDVGLIIFDEFHERSLDTDLGLALTLQARELFREQLPLKLLIMSATLDTKGLENLIDAQIVRCEGRSFPVDIIYHKQKVQREYLLAETVETILLALSDQAGSLLVFLPGQAEIRQVENRLKERLSSSMQLNTMITPLYGDLAIEVQIKAITPAPEGMRKVVLTTSIAETSLTIEGISTVIDSGLSRSAIYDLNTGMSRLHTHSVSRASSEQRAGRAGRTSPGVCYRLWTESQQKQLAAYSNPEILEADLAPLLLQLHLWGCKDPNELLWLNPPIASSIKQAEQLLLDLGALHLSPKGIHLTAHGELISSIAAHPRIAHMLVIAKQFGLEETASDLAAILMERDPLKIGQAELSLRLDWLSNSNAGDHSGLRGRIKRLSSQLRQQMKKITVDAASQSIDKHDEIGFLIAHAWPERIAINKGDPQRYLLSNGRAAQLNQNDHLNNVPWLAIANLGGRHDQATDAIWLAEPFNPALLTSALSHLLSTHDIVEWNDTTQRLTAETQKRCGSLIVSKHPLSTPSQELIISTLCDLIRKQGLQILPWSAEIERWRSRVMFLYAHSQQSDNLNTTWPDLSNETLTNTLEKWLAPYLADIRHINHFQKLDLLSILQALLPWPLPQTLDRQAPERIKVPSGNAIRLDYSQSPPVLAVKLQEMFGCEQTPCIAQDVKLKIHLLSPAGRPLQVTQDLASFWQNSYPDVCKEMRGRYPKHPWPDNPLIAVATQKTKKHLT